MTAVPTYVGAATGGSSLNSFNLRTDVTGALPGDFLLMGIQTSNEAVPSTPTGWTEFSSSPQGTGTGGAAGSVRLTLYWRWADTATCAVNAAVSTGDSGNHQLGRVWAFRGVSRTNPINAQTGNVTASSATISIPAVTTTVDNCLVVDVLSDGIDSTANRYTTPPANATLSGYNFGTDGVGTTTGTGGAIDIGRGGLATAGSSGTSDGTYNTTPNSAYIKFALAPANSPWLVALAGVVGSTSNTARSWPTGHQADDIGVLFVETAGGESITTPSGWTQFAHAPQASNTGTNGTRLDAYWRRATSGAESDAALSDAGDHVHGVMLVLRGCRTSGDPYTLDGGGTKGTASTSVSATGITTTVDNQFVVVAVTRDNDSSAAEFSSWANANLSAFVEVLDEGGVFGNGGGFGVASGVLGSAGATGTTTATTTNSDENAFLTIAFTAATAAATVTRSFAIIIG